MHNWLQSNEEGWTDGDGSRSVREKRKHRKETWKRGRGLPVCVCVYARTAVIAWQLQGYLTCMTAAARVCHLYFTARLRRSSLVCVCVCICVVYIPVASKFTLILAFPLCRPLSLSPNTDLIAWACSVMLRSLHMLCLNHITHTCLRIQQFVRNPRGI